MVRTFVFTLFAIVLALLFGVISLNIWSSLFLVFGGGIFIAMCIGAGNGIPEYDTDYAEIKKD